MTHQNYFPMGQYSFPFSFVLGENLPGTFEHRWNEAGYEAYGKIKYKIKAGLKNKEMKAKIFGKTKIVVDEKFIPGQSNLAPAMVDKSVSGYCYTSHGVYKMCAIFSTNKYIVGDKATVSVAVDAREASTDIKNLKCQLVMRTDIHANGRSGHKDIIIQSIDIGEVKAGSALMDNDSITVQLDITTPGELQASASGDHVKNNFFLQWVAEIDGCVCYDENPTNKIKVGVYNKHYGMPTPSGNFMGGGNWQPQMFDPYYAQLNNNTRMNAEFKNAYKPNYQNQNQIQN